MPGGGEEEGEAGLCLDEGKRREKQAYAWRRGRRVRGRPTPGGGEDEGEAGLRLEEGKTRERQGYA